MGLDTRAIGEACVAISRKHPTLASLFVSVDVEKGKGLAYAAVPDFKTDRLKANEWVVSALGGRRQGCQRAGPVP